MDAEPIRKILAHEDEIHGRWLEQQEKWGFEPGFEWEDVRVDPRTLKQLVIADVLRVVHKTSKHKTYRLIDREATRAALEHHDRVLASLDDPMSESPSVEIPDDLFDIIIGYDDVKRLVRMVLEADDQVHLLFVGEPATAKSLFFQEISRLPGVYFAVGSLASGAGLVDVLFNDRPDILIIDEIDKLAQNASELSALLSLMEDGRVIQTKHNKTRSTQLKTKVFAAGNDDSKIPPELMSRFLKPLYFKRYSESDFYEVCVGFLTRRMGCDMDVAREIATVTWRDLKGDIRTARAIARLVDNQKIRVEEVAGILKGYSRPPL